MLAQHLKDIYYIANRFLCWPNTILARWRYRRPATPEGHYLHLGCGPDYISGMVNVDGNLRRRRDLWIDLRNRLPFRDDSVYILYCSHTLEHLFPYEALALLKEMRRVISVKGAVRLAVPSFEHCLEIALGRCSSSWPRQLDNSTSQAINYLFCDGQHKYAYSAELLEEFARQAGFGQVENYSASFGVAPKVYGRVSLGNEPLGSLVFELRK